MSSGFKGFRAFPGPRGLCRIGVPVNGIKADPPVACLFADAYTKQTKRERKPSMDMHILLLEKLNPIRLPSLEVKKITLEDNYALTREQIQFVEEGISGQEGLYFLIKDNVPISQAAIRRKVSMGGVYTPENTDETVIPSHWFINWRSAFWETATLLQI